MTTRGMIEGLPRVDLNAIEVTERRRVVWLLENTPGKTVMVEVGQLRPWGDFHNPDHWHPGANVLDALHHLIDSGVNIIITGTTCDEWLDALRSTPGDGR